MRVPTESEVLNYSLSLGYRINAAKFLAYYEAVGWMRGKTRIKDWRRCVVTWKLNSQEQEIMKPVQETEEQRRRRFLGERKCITCKGGKLVKNEELRIYECSGCPSRYAIEKVEG